ncbi:Uncharacterised protein [Mycobacteroides abscessus subsp. abscessus]|nr:Uncharacterised protein [Mycobacteroides abscessus subsp. abscessus]
MPATTPYRRPSGSLLANTSKVARRPAVPSRSAAASMVSSYLSVSNDVHGCVMCATLAGDQAV